ncbi:MAG: pantoate--beta-alanine ligase [Alphaproteobacteria bacterium]
MKIFATENDIKDNLLNTKGLSLVPTMGNLHEGHLSLIKEAKNYNNKTIVSIFINPLQFGPNEDFKNYPRTITSDIKKLEKIDCDYAFIPKNNFAKKLNLIKAPSISRKLCGKNRPGHFDGVLTIIDKIFSVILPAHAFFGLKDYQQFILIREFTKNYFPGIKIIGLPIIREKDGLAMSSRNNLLTKDERKIAPSIYENLIWIENNRKKFTIPELIKLSSEKLERENIQIDYLGIFDKKSLKKARNFEEGALIAVAAKIGKVRLIDNIILNKS